MSEKRLRAWLGAALLWCGFPVASLAEELPAPLLACTAEQDDARRLACFDEATARLRRDGGTAAGTGSAAAPTVAAAGPTASAAAAASPAPAAAAPAAAATTSAPVAAATAATVPATAAAGERRTVTPEEEFGLRGQVKEEKLGRISELVSTVKSLQAKPYGELVITLANEQVWSEIAPGSKIKLKPGDTVTIEAGAMRSFILIAPNGRSSRVTRVR